MRTKIARIVAYFMLCQVAATAFAEIKPAPIEALTTGPQYHWFGYYDKFQFDPTDRYVLGMQVDFEHRSPTEDDVVKIGMIDLDDGKRWIELGTSRAWCWQQGCMLQWRPGSDTEILWNDREGDRFVCRILDTKTRKMRTLPYPIYHVSPDGKHALGADFARIQDFRRGYGYPGVPDKNEGVLAPEDSYVYLLDLDTGDYKPLVSVADIARIRFEGMDVKNGLYFNHIQWSPDGERFIMFNRGRGVPTHVYTADRDGSDIRFLAKDSSHFVWRDPEHVLIWAHGGYRLYKDDGSGNNSVVWKAPNGHQSYLPGKEWIVTDTYPQGESREQVVYLYHVPSGKKVELGRFHSPDNYRGGGGEWRCDTHPRLSRDGTKVVIDSAHGGNGRQMYMIDISEIVKND